MSSSQALNCIHRSITGLEATELLMTEGKDGSFLIRPSSSNADDLTLSVRRNDEVIHIKIQQTDDFIDLYGGEQFASLPQLIDYYVNGLGRGNLRESNGKLIHLKNPLPAQKYRGERWFHANLTSTESEVMLKNLKKEGSFLVRESSKKSGEFVLCYLNKDHDVIHVIISKKKGLYSIGDGLNCFPSLTELIDYYRSHDMVVMFKKNSNYSFRLQKSCVAGATAVKNLEGKIAELEKEFDDRDKKRNGFWEEFEHVQTMEHNEASNRPMTAGYAPENKVKNRYRNILPYDDTRVKLVNVNPSEPGSDYINANYINARRTLPHIHKSYIACQGCVKVTIHDFWNMVWQENINIIVMTTELIENGKNKCFLYWSETPEPLMVDLYKGPLSVTTESSTDHKDYTLRVFTLFHNNQKRTVHQYHHRKWPDKCTPKDATGVVDFVLEINMQAAKVAQNNQSSPWLIHCSAGIGRTGTFILIDLIINQIHREGLGCIIDIPKLLMDIRNQRAGLVQTEKQYTFVYKAVLLYVTKYYMKKAKPATEKSNNSTTVTSNNSNVALYSNIDPNLASNLVKPNIIGPKPTEIYENIK